MLLLWPLVGAACARGATPASPAARAEYTCGSIPVAIDFRRDSAFVSLPDTALSLPLALSASGARYSDGVSTVWEHQGRLRVELPDTSFTDCPRRDPPPPAA